MSLLGKVWKLAVTKPSGTLLADDDYCCGFSKNYQSLEKLMSELLDKKMCLVCCAAKGGGGWETQSKKINRAIHLLSPPVYYGQ